MKQMNEKETAIVLTIVLRDEYEIITCSYAYNKEHRGALEKNDFGSRIVTILDSQNITHMSVFIYIFHCLCLYLSCKAKNSLINNLHSERSSE